MDKDYGQPFLIFVYTDFDILIQRSIQKCSKFYSDRKSTFSKLDWLIESILLTKKEA